MLEAKALYARFFETVEKRPLTDEQIEAVLAFDDLNLTVAAAGSGKTSVIVAKVGFALASGMFRDGDVLVLAFNRDAANELRCRIRDRLESAATERQSYGSHVSLIGESIAPGIDRRGCSAREVGRLGRQTALPSGFRPAVHG